MKIRTVCPGCGKTLRFSEDDAGKTSLCFACGTAIQIPGSNGAALEVDDATPDEALPAARGATPLDVPVVPVALTPPRSAPATPPTKTGPAHPFPSARGSGCALLLLGILAGLAIALIVVGAAALYFKAHHRSSSADKRATILRMIDEADQAAIDGKPREAYEKYKQVEQFVGDQNIDGDEELSHRLAQSRQRRDQMLRLASAAEGKRNSASTPPPTIVSPRKPPQVALPASQPVSSPAVARTTPPPVEPKMPESPPLPAPPRPIARRQTSEPSPITDEQIGEAIHKAQGYLISQFQNGVLNTNDRFGMNRILGADALAVYALLQSAQAVKDEHLSMQGPFVKAMLDRLRTAPIADNLFDGTYTCALRASALALSNRPEDLQQVRADVAWLERGCRNGAYSYNIVQGQHGAWDNSNSQYGLLGVWAGAEVVKSDDSQLLEIPTGYWTEIERHWASTQLRSGQWAYIERDPTGRINMTLAGIASLFVTHDYLDAPRLSGQVGRPPFSTPLARGLAWLETADNVTEVNGGYGFYGLERVGLASGFKFFGQHDWYREVATRIVAAQNPDGSFFSPGPFSIPLPDTCFCLLFLSRGRHPVMMSKLRYDGDWANRPRDLANLARFASRELERPINWQVVPIDRRWQDWADAPILYLAGDKPIDLTDAQRENIRQFVQNGGLLLTQADGDSAAFTQFATQLGKDLFAPYDWKDLPPDHPLFNSLYKLDARRAKVRAITNGSRILMVHLPQDVSRYWQTRSETAQLAAFRFGVNLFVYAAGHTEMRNRIDSPYIAPPAQQPATTLTVARLSYDGNWDPEPAAWPRLANWIASQSDLGLKLTSVPIAQITPAAAPVAHLTGTGSFHPSTEETAVLKAYVTAGGILLVDPTGGPGSFLNDFNNFIATEFPDDSPHRISVDQAPMAEASGGGEDLKSVPIRPFRPEGLNVEDAAPRILHAGKGAVIVCPVDLTSGLLGTHTWGIAGYEPEASLAFARNVMVWAAGRVPGSKAPAATEP